MTTHIQSIVFDPEGVEIVYAEESDVYKSGLRIYKTAVVPRSLVVNELAELEEAAIALVDEVGVIKRSPESTFTR